MDKNVIKTLPAYITECIINSVMLIVMYKTTIFRCIGDLSYTLSEIVFYALFVILLIIGIVMTAKRYRNSINSYLNPILPLGIYTCISYINDMKAIIIILSALSAASIILFVVLYARNKHIPTNRISKNRILQIFIGSKNIISIASILLIVPMVLKVILFNSLFTPDQASADPRTEQWEISDNYQELKLLADDNQWEAASNKERLNSLQTMANISASSLGIPHELKVSIGSAKPNVLAHYREQYYSITFNSDMIDDITASEALRAILHECYHAYQYCLVDLLKDADEKYYNISDVQKALKYKAEFSSYEDGATDYDSYADQWCEYYANDYADICSEKYRIEINYYLDRNNTKEAS